jgi:glycosyltransferase involved in cell wall biosynthesis
LERRADDLGADARFLGFLDREELAAFYSALDAFAFPSPVETQGLVALEANACGTPVVGANAGALANTIEDGETGYHYESGNVEDFRAAIERTLAEREELQETCLARREASSVEHAVEKLQDVYDSIR